MGYDTSGCPFRYALGVIGDRWSLLIVRDLVFYGYRHYGEFLEAGEGISTNILADRLSRLEQNGILERSPAPDHGRKIIYRLTQKGEDLIPVLLAIMDWSIEYDEETDVSPEFTERLRKQRGALEAELRRGVRDQSSST